MHSQFQLRFMVAEDIHHVELYLSPSEQPEWGITINNWEESIPLSAVFQLPYYDSNFNIAERDGTVEVYRVDAGRDWVWRVPTDLWNDGLKNLLQAALHLVLSTEQEGMEAWVKGIMEALQHLHERKTKCRS